mmetsp:Transcript_20512/g.52060  ORF Transcript_20512/g.52060 Transcript_20512/m.52060 type:complete len:653 (+) Transcript_20512:1344-3302(+)
MCSNTALGQSEHSVHPEHNTCDTCLVHLTILFFYLLVFMVLVACGWWLVSDSASTRFTDPWQQSQGLESVSKFEMFLSCLYFATGTMATVGFGDIVATSTSERAYTIASMMVGVAFIGGLVGEVSTIVVDFKTHNAEKRDRVRHAMELMRRHGLPLSLQVRVQNHLRASIDMAMGLKLRAQVFDQLAGSPLLAELQLQVDGPTLRTHWWMKSLEHTSVERLCGFARVLVYLPGEVMFTAKSLLEREVFLRQGTVAELRDDTCEPDLPDPKWSRHRLLELWDALVENGRQEVGLLLRRWTNSLTGSMPTKPTEKPLGYPGLFVPAPARNSVLSASFVEALEMRQTDMEITMNEHPEDRTAYRGAQLACAIEFHLPAVASNLFSTAASADDACQLAAQPVRLGEDDINRGLPPVLRCAKESQAEVLYKVLQHGADQNFLLCGSELLAIRGNGATPCNLSGTTALNVALARFNVEVAASRDVLWSLCLDPRADSGLLDVLDVLEQNDALKAAERKGADATQAVAHLAASTGRRDILEELKIRGKIHLSHDYSRRTLLHSAVRGGHLALAQFLVAAGSDVNAVATDTGATPLHVAAAVGAEDVVQFLVQKGANLGELGTCTTATLPRDPRNQTDMLPLIVSGTVGGTISVLAATGR